MDDPAAEPADGERSAPGDGVRNAAGAWPEGWAPLPVVDWPSGWRVTVVAETGSTNADLLAAARAGGADCPDRTVLVAAHQRAGRGRQGRTWDAPPGRNLLVSLLFRDLPDDPHELTQRVGLAALAATERLTRLRPHLKWPNDVLVGDAKLAGILAERSDTPSGTVVVVGLGLNIGWAPPDAVAWGGGTHPLQALAAVLTAFDGLPAVVRSAYRRRLGTLGRLVRVELPDGAVVTGRAVDVDRLARLVIELPGGRRRTFAAGDVTHLRHR